MKTFTMRMLGVVAAISLLGLVMAYLAGFFESKITPEALVINNGKPVGNTITVKTVTVKTVTEPIIEQATGTIRAKNETVISARIMATIASLSVRAGDTVKTGDILATLDSRELGARLDQQQEAVAAARARLNEIESNYNRIAPLVAKGVATQAEFDRAEAALRAAQAELAGAMRATDEANTALS
jgi:multidrug efflux pump subunit AcrA (membrane-fusion protein)